LAKTFDKTKIKEQIAKQVEQEQIEDLNHLQEKKKKLNRSELFKREENESESST
jgi:hypothetical protein